MGYDFFYTLSELFQIRKAADAQIRNSICASAAYLFALPLQQTLRIIPATFGFFYSI